MIRAAPLLRLPSVAGRSAWMIRSTAFIHGQTPGVAPDVISPPPTTLFRPQVVAEKQASRVAVVRSKWQAFKIITWIVTITAGVTVAVFGPESAPSDAAQGIPAKDHVLTPLRTWARQVYVDFVTGRQDNNNKVK